MEFGELLVYLMGLSPIVGYVFMGLGAIVVIAIGLDKVIDDKHDKGFSKKILSIPILGDLLRALTKFSPFNNRDNSN